MLGLDMTRAQMTLGLRTLEVFTTKNDQNNELILQPFICKEFDLELLFVVYSRITLLLPVSFCERKYLHFLSPLEFISSISLR